jgi:hypothetical protein
MDHDERLRRAFEASPALRRAMKPSPALQRALRDATAPSPTRTMRSISEPSSAVARALEELMEPSSAAARAMEQVARPSSALAQAMERFMGPESAAARTLEQAMEQLSRPSSAIARALEQLASPSSAFSQTVQRFANYDWAALSESLHTVIKEMELEAELGEAFENVEAQVPDAMGNLARTLAALPLPVQMALVVAGLHILDSAGQLQAAMTGAEVPPALRASIDLLFATVAFLILWIQQLESPDDG